MHRADAKGIMEADQGMQYDLSMYPTPSPAAAGGYGYDAYGGGGASGGGDAGGYDLSMYPTPAPAPAALGGVPAGGAPAPLPAAAPPATPPPPPVTTPAPAEVDFSWEGENCVHSSCCRRDGMSCWEKMADVWASCQKTCEDLSKWDDDDWTCTNLGGSKGKHQVAQASSPPSVSLFCFMVVTPEGVVPPGVEPGYEQQLVDAMKKSQASVFACEASAVYEGLRTDVGEWKSIKNTDIFIKVWKDVKAGGLWEQNDWTVKADADAVFFPDRLKMHIKGVMAPLTEGVYFHNINFKFHFMGALEVMNQAAVRTLMKEADNCLTHIGNNGGEDIFTMECLDSVGVGYMEDFALLDDKYSSPAAFNLFDVDRCDNDATVAFHPYKAVNAWMGCYKVAMKINKPSDFTSCEHRWEGEACSLSSTNDHPGHIDPGTGIVIGE